MKVTAEIIQHEFIGLKAKVVKSTNPDCEGLSGTIIDETRNTFLLNRNGKERCIIKETSVFHFIYPDGTVVEIDGKLLVSRPEDRIKKTIRRHW